MFFARLFLLLLLPATAFAGQGPARVPDEEDVRIDNFIRAVETSITTMDSAKWAELLSQSADRASAMDFFSAMVPQGITRAVVKERDRAPLQGTLGLRLAARDSCALPTSRLHRGVVIHIP